MGFDTFPHNLNELITWACLSQFDDVADFGLDGRSVISYLESIYQRVKKKRHWQEFESFDEGITN